MTNPMAESFSRIVANEASSVNVLPSAQRASPHDPFQLVVVPSFEEGCGFRWRKLVPKSAHERNRIARQWQARI